LETRESNSDSTDQFELILFVNLNIFRLVQYEYKGRPQPIEHSTYAWRAGDALIAALVLRKKLFFSSDRTHPNSEADSSFV